MRYVVRISTFIFVFLIGQLLSIQSAFAAMSLSQSIIHFENGAERSRDVDVFNQGEETLYIRVVPSIVLNPGTTQETREKYRDPRKAGLLVSPQRLVIAPGGRKRIRFVRLDIPSIKSSESKQVKTKQKTSNQSVIENDRVFRVLVKPEVGDIQSEQTAVKIVVAYEVLVLSQPPNPVINLESKLIGKQLHIINHGNTNALLLDGHQCPKGQSVDDDNNQCVRLQGKRIYAGNEWQIEVPFKTPVTYQVSVGLENSIQTFELLPL